MSDFSTEETTSSVDTKTAVKDSVTFQHSAPHNECQQTAFSLANLKYNYCYNFVNDAPGHLLGKKTNNHIYLVAIPPTYVA